LGASSASVDIRVRVADSVDSRVHLNGGVNSGGISGDNDDVLGGLKVPLRDDLRVDDGALNLGDGAVPGEQRVSDDVPGDPSEAGGVIGVDSVDVLAVNGQVGAAGGRHEVTDVVEKPGVLAEFVECGLAGGFHGGDAVVRVERRADGFSRGYGSSGVSGSGVGGRSSSVGGSVVGRSSSVGGSVVRSSSVVGSVVGRSRGGSTSSGRSGG